MMRLSILLGCLTALTVLTGCNGMVQTYEDRKNTYSRVLDTDTRQLVDDWDTFWMADRQTRLTEWYTR
jgi:hypothetical protein